MLIKQYSELEILYQKDSTGIDIYYLLIFFFTEKGVFVFLFFCVFYIDVPVHIVPYFQETSQTFTGFVLVVFFFFSILTYMIVSMHQKHLF